MKQISVQIDNRDHVEATVTEAGEISYKAKGCLELLERVEEARVKANSISALESWEIGSLEHSDLLMNELKKKVLGIWDLPYKDKELCHCRAVDTHLVVSSIYSGARDVPSVGKSCSAGTSCGNCQPDITACLDYLTKS